MAEFKLLSVGIEQTGRGWQEPYIGGTNDRRLMPMFTFEASVGANTNVWLLFKCITAPSDTLKLLLTWITGSSGNAQIGVTWQTSGVGFNWDTVSLANSEGTTQIAVAAGDINEIQETKINLDAGTDPTAGQYLQVQIQAQTTSWTLSGKSFWWASLLDEV